MHTAHKATFLQNTQNNTQQFPIILWIMHSQTRVKWGNRFSSLREAFSRELGHDAKQVFVCLSFNGHKNYFLRWGPRGLSFTWWGCCATELAHSFLFRSCVCFCLFVPFNCISFHNPHPPLSGWWTTSSSTSPQTPQSKVVAIQSLRRPPPHKVIVSWATVSIPCNWLCCSSLPGPGQLAGARGVHDVHAGGAQGV